MSARPHVYIKKQKQQVTVEVRVFAPRDTCRECLTEMLSAAVVEAIGDFPQRWPETAPTIICLDES